MRLAAERKDRDRSVSGKSKQNAVKTMVVADGDGRVLFCSPTRPGSCADITPARQSGLVTLLADGPRSHRKFKKNAPDWYEEMHERQREAHFSRRIRVGHGIAHLKN
ncbi:MULTISPECIES: transposase family protein [Streptomyces]|uniref:transposase family protein n=1 Tax=Streptomyces TaxID=1883 RepID=UPI003699446D